MKQAGERILSGTLLDEQLKIEGDSINEGVRRYRALVEQAVAKGQGASLKPVERLLVHWLGPLTEQIKSDRRLLAARGGDLPRDKHHIKYRKGVEVWGPAIRLLKDPRQYAVAALRELLSMMMQAPDGITVARAANAIGAACFAEAHMQLMRTGHKDAVAELDRQYRRLTSARINKHARTVLGDGGFAMRARVRLGVRLLMAIVTLCSADAYDKPFKDAFWLKVRRRGHIKVRYVLMDNACWRIIANGHEARQFLRPLYMPMVCQPVPRSTDKPSGYLGLPVTLIANVKPAQSAAVQTADMRRVYRAVDWLSGAPLRINKRVFAVQQKLYEMGGALGDLPPASDPPMPTRPDDWRTNKEWQHATWKWNTLIRRMAGARFEYAQIAQIASRMIGYKAIYFPHRMDFRGRFMPRPMYLNMHGNDVQRGLLEFANPVPMGDDGFRWLCIHAANCWAQGGLDKKTFGERVAWVRQHAGEIDLCCRDPLDNRWWLGAENPWQFLAACYALDDPEGAGARVMVGTDGTCNGLQHYTAIGRDAAAAALVNMLPADAPRDIYATVAEETRRRLEAMGDEEALRFLPLAVRAVVKQPVMTTTYGVTQYGARQQMLDAFKAIGYEGKELYRATKRFADVVLDSLGTVCAGARAVMEWLYTCAEATTEKGYPLAWTSPLGLPIIAPYRNRRAMTIRTALMDVTLRADDETLPVKARKQRSSAPPNFVHGHDASHLGMTACVCDEGNIPLVAIHDKFISHAGNHTALSLINREQFVKMHSRPLLDEFRDELQARYQVKIAPPPTLGSYDLSDVIRAPYFFH